MLKMNGKKNKRKKKKSKSHINERKNKKGERITKAKFHGR